MLCDHVVCGYIYMDVRMLGLFFRCAYVRLACLCVCIFGCAGARILWIVCVLLRVVRCVQLLDA